MNLAPRKTKYVSLSGGTNVTTPVVEIPEGDFIYTFNVEPDKTKGITSSKGYERIDGNNTDPSNAILGIYTYDTLTGTAPVQGDIVNDGIYNHTVCGIVETTATTGYIYLIADDVVAPAVSVFTVGTGGFVTSDYRFIQRLPGSKFPPNILSTIERPFYDFAIEIQRAKIQAVPGVGPVVGVAQDPSNLRLLAVRSDGVNDVLYQSIPGTGWTIIPGTSFTSSTYYRFKDITQGLTDRRLYITNGIDDLHYWDSVAETAGSIPSVVGGITMKPEFVEYHMDRVTIAAQNYIFTSARETPDFVLNAFGLETNYLITGLSRLVNNGLLTITEKSIYILDGDPDNTSPAFGTFKEVSTETGGIQNTLDSSDYPYFINRYGISNLTDTDRAGRYEVNPLSDKVLPIVTNRYDKDGLPVSYVGAFVDRRKDLYRVYRSNGICFNMLKTLHKSYDNTSTQVANRQRYYPIMFNDYEVGIQCIGEAIDYDGEQILAGSGFDTNFVGDHSGFVYRMESGFSLDGRPIIHSFKTPYVHFGSPSINKRYFKYTMNVIAPEQITITYKADYNYGDSRFSEQLDLDTISGLSRFNRSSFNAATWSSNFVSEVGGYLNGSGINVSLNVNVETQNTDEFTIQGIIYHYIPRGLKR